MHHGVHGGKRHGGSYNEYVNYDWEDARERDLRDREGRESYFRTRFSHFFCDKNYAHRAFFVFQASAYQSNF